MCWSRLSVAAATSTSSPVLPLTSRCFYLATFYSLARKRTEAYALYYCVHSLANDALKKFKSLTTADQVMIKELKMLYDDSRSSSCIEHATGIIEKEKAPENLLKKISTISLTGADKKGFDMFGKRVGFVKFDADVVPGIVFARGPAVAVLILLELDGKTYAVLTEQVPDALSGHRESMDYETDENPHTPPPDDEMQPLLSM
ncbi:hypothetical protein ACSBR1_037690 [Camellia fascicularis]